jgi:sulfotransferase family protein
MRSLQAAVKEVRYRLRPTALRKPIVWLRHWGISPNDVFLASHQRSGSTWLRFLLCEVLTKNSADFNSVRLTLPDIRHHRQGLKLAGDGRLIKTHEPYREVYKKAIYIVRDPRDVAVSLHEYDRPSQGFDRFVSSFVQGKATAHGSWYRNVRSWLDSPLVGNGNLLLVKYETMRADPQGALVSILQFLGGPIEPEAIRSAIANNSLHGMRAKEDRARATGLEVSGEKIRSRGRGVRNGLVGEWRARLTEAQAKLIEDHAGELLAKLGYAGHLTPCEAKVESESGAGLDDTGLVQEFGGAAST